MSSSNRVQVGFKPEVTPGTYAGGNMQALPIRSENFAAANETFSNDSLDGNRRMKRGLITGRNKTAQTPFYLDLAEVFHSLFNGMMYAIPVASNTITATDISALAADNSLNSVAGDFQAVVGQSVFVSGFSNSANNGLKRVLTATPAKLTFAESLVDEVAGPAVKVVESKLWRDGSTPQFYSMQRAWLDHTPVGYDQFLAMLMASNSLSYQQGNNPFGFDMSLTGLGTRHVAGDQIPTLTSDSSLGTVDPAPNPELLSPAVRVYSIFRSGIQATNLVNNFQISTDHNLQPFNALGHLGPANLIVGDFNVSGTFEAEFTNRAQLDAVRQLAIDSFALAALDSQNRMLVATVPSAELQSGEPSAGSRNQTLTLPISYSGIDNGLGYALQLEYFDLS